MSYLAKLKEKIGEANATLAPAKASEGAFAASAASPVASTARNSPGIALPAEMERLIARVATFHAFSVEDIREAREIAAGDVASALVCFRRLANGVEAPPLDDRVTCADCGNLVRGRCQAAAQGLSRHVFRIFPGTRHPAPLRALQTERTLMDAVKRFMTEAAEATLRSDADAVTKATAALAALERSRLERTDSEPEGANQSSRFTTGVPLLDLLE